MSSLAIDDGLTTGNLNIADIFFQAGAILGLIAAILAAPRRAAPTGANASSWSSPVAFLAIGCIAFGLFLL